ncbi:putative ribosomal protein S15 [Ehrlichia cf. muris str. EmCRT]|nr:putative ribosomal protein S15 [Ehrlichia cf. muris str. EmCRT]
MVLVCRRRNVLQYVRKKYGDNEYLALIKRLGIRDIFH